LVFLLLKETIKTPSNRSPCMLTLTSQLPLCPHSLSGMKIFGWVI